MSPDNETEAAFQVLLNAEEQYSIWPSDKAVPEGWRSAGVSGPKTRCLEYIETVWADMRPLSLRRQMDAAH